MSADLLKAILGTDDFYTVKSMVEAPGFDVNAVMGVEKMTPLMYAAREGRYDIVKLLLENGADIRKKSELEAFRGDKTAVDFAEENVAKAQELLNDLKTMSGVPSPAPAPAATTQKRGWFGFGKKKKGRKTRRRM